MSGRERVLVAMSGGVDSSVAAALLAEAGHEVLGVTMRVRPGEEAAGSRSCCSLEDVDDARRVADRLGIPFYALDMAEAFQRSVVDDFVGEYLAGRTPNPCVRCNVDLKFGELMAKARALGIEAVATGHYARVEWDPARGRWALRRARDPAKDQSYALHGLAQAQLARARFPLGELTKAEVRAHAARLGLGVAAKPDSQDLCFVPGGDYRPVLARLAGDRARPGRMVDGTGRDLGAHPGIGSYTVGQRRGLGLGGEARRYVVALDPARDRVIVGSREEALRDGFEVDEVNWVAGAPPGGRIACRVQVRHRSLATEAVVTPRGPGGLAVRLARADPGLSPGQAAVLYDGDVVLGGGPIARVLTDRLEV